MGLLYMSEPKGVGYGNGKHGTNRERAITLRKLP